MPRSIKLTWHSSRWTCQLIVISMLKKGQNGGGLMCTCQGTFAENKIWNIWSLSWWDGYKHFYSSQGPHDMVRPTSSLPLITPFKSLMFRPAWCSPWPQLDPLLNRLWLSTIIYLSIWSAIEEQTPLLTLGNQRCDTNKLNWDICLVSSQVSDPTIHVTVFSSL